MSRFLDPFAVIFQTLKRASSYSTVNFALLLAAPPFVVTAILPVFAPLGTIAVTWVSELAVKADATPPKATFVACVRRKTDSRDDHRSSNRALGWREGLYRSCRSWIRTVELTEN